MVPPSSMSFAIFITVISLDQDVCADVCCEFGP